MKIEIIDYLYYFMNLDNFLDIDIILKNDINIIIEKIMNTYREVFNIKVFIFDNKNYTIKKDSLKNIIFEDLIFTDIDYTENYIKEHVELALKNKSYIITEFNGVIISILPIYLSKFKKYALLLIDNSKGYIKIKDIREICKKRNYNNKKYIEYFKNMKKYSKKEFYNTVKTFSNLIFNFCKDKNIYIILKQQKIIKNILKDIKNNLPYKNIIEKAYKDYLETTYLKNINIFIKKNNSKKYINFFQIFKNNFNLNNKEEIKEKLKLYNYDINKFLKNEESYLKKNNIYIKSINVSLNKSTIEHIFILEDEEKFSLKKRDLNFLKFIGKVILNYYLFKNKEEEYKNIDAFYNLMDNIKENIHVIDCQTGKILYYNKNFAKEFNIDSKKDIFVKDIYNYNSRKIGEFYNYKSNKWFYNNTKIEKWIDNKEVIINIDMDITENKKKDYIINKLKCRNNISNLPNREKLIKDLNILFKDFNTARYIILIKIDLFSKINFSYGYKYGDDLILQIANYLINFNKNILVYHLGGVEFGLISDSKELTEEIVEIILNRFKKPWIINSLEQYCTVSIGISKFPIDGTNGDIIIKNAAAALKRAKIDTRGKVFYFNSEIDSNLVKKLQVEYFLKIAVMKDKNSFKVFYQPIVDTKTGKIVSAEALVRWADQELGFMKPDEFIYLAEELGIINIIGNHVLEIACITIKKINKQFKRNITVSINLSPMQLYEENAYINIKNIIDKTGINYEYINLEITENTAIIDIENTRKKLNKLRSLGIKISLDDFGTGYSSLNTLQEMPINILKIDKYFIKKMKDSRYNYVFVKTIIELAHSTNIKVCCEGIETIEEWNELKKLNTDVLQGYLFSKPLSEKEFINFIKNTL